MKNLKIFGIIMMLVMSMSSISCSSDDDSGPGEIGENIEGGWFRVKEKFVCSDDGTVTAVWDYNNQTEEGVYSDGALSKISVEPERIYVEQVGKNRYEFIRMTYNLYYERWREEGSFIYELDGNLIYEEDSEEGSYAYNTKAYIKSISQNELVVVWEEVEIDKYDEVTHKDVQTITYRRNF